MICDCNFAAIEEVGVIFCCFAVKTLVVKGRAPVDPECHVANSVHVYVEGSDVYDVMLNQVSTCTLIN